MENNTQDSIKKRKKSRHTLFWIIFLEVVVVLAGLAYLIWEVGEASRFDSESSFVTHLSYEETEKVTEADGCVPEPDIDEQILSINEWSRPGTKIKRLDYIVIHYLGNPKTTAQENHDYFESLGDLHDTYMSANYVIGLDGEIIHCVPDDEVAFASNSANNFSISIENCHPDKSGKFTDETYASLVNLVAYLSDKYDIDRDHIIRHYDVTGKECPLYFVKHEDKWIQFLDEVMAYRQECEEEALRQKAQTQTERKVDELAAFLESNAGEE